MDAANHLISTQSLIWLILVVFVIHDMEEIIWVEPWMRRYRDKLQSVIPKRILPRISYMFDITSSQFAVAVLIEFVVLATFTLLAAEHGIFLMYLAFNTLMFLHVFSHVGQSLILRKYTPGVVTAVLLVFPYSVYLFMRLTNEGIVSWQEVTISIPLGLILLPIVFDGHKIGKIVIPSECTH